MKKLEESKILFLLAAATGLGICTMPNSNIEQLGADWLTIIAIATVLAVLATFIIAYIGGKFPGKTVFDYGGILLGKWMGYVIAAILGLYFTMCAAVMLRVFTDVIGIFLLPDTPPVVVAILLLLAAAYIVISGLRTIARTCKYFILISVASIVALVTSSAQNFRAVEVGTFLQNDAMTLIMFVPYMFFLFLGAATLFISSAFVGDPKKLKIYAPLGVLMGGLSLFFTQGMALGVFGRSGLQHITYPVISLARMVSFRAAVTERLEILLLFTWILTMFLSIAISYYNAAYSFAYASGVKNIYPFGYMLAPIIFCAAMYLQRGKDFGIFDQIVIYLGIAIVAVIPILLLGAMLLKKVVKKGEKT